VAEEVLDYLVVGAGPAGLQLGQFLGHAGHRYLVLEAGSAPGHFFETFPRHRTLISINKKHTGYTDPELRLRMDWNSILADGDDDPVLFTDYSEKLFPDAEDLLRYLADYVEKHQVDVRYDTRVTRIRREDERFVLTAGDEVFRTRRLIMATGVTKPYIPDFPGAELIDQYVDVDVDPASFTDQRVLVLGKGNSAFETADNLIEQAAVVHVGGPRPVKLA